MDPERFSFGTDFHGNWEAIDAFLAVSSQSQVGHVIFGGDIAPKKMAMVLGDGNAVSPNFELAESPSFDSGAEMARHGYMLFDAGLDDAQMLTSWIGVHRELMELAQPHTMYNYHRWTQSQIDFLGQVVFPRFVRFFNTTPHGTTVFSRFSDAYKRFYPHGEINVESFFDTLFKSIQTFYWMAICPDHCDKKVKALLCGDENAVEEDKRLKLGALFKFSNVNCSSLLITACNYAMPWNEWQTIQSQLHLHAFEKQNQFLQAFVQRISEFRQRFSGTVSLILGNDDAFELQQTLDEADHQGILTHATNRVVSLSSQVQMIGYSYVPPILSVDYDAWFKEETDIGNELFYIAQGLNSDTPFTIANIHCPPSDTRVSKTLWRGQVGDYGSLGVRTFLEKIPPTVALSGHIHEPWKIPEGGVMDYIHHTPVFNPGASETSPRILVAHFKDLLAYQLMTPLAS
ncbi:MAG: hypothetical protein ACD_28C00292G0002 [uncultured bacterium]|nr:MAG: hypothetical protein ACD_28C00292G0002 [uncultured bacterium]KKT77025.1 MAG: hypothetical protein UW70_C0005G0005 [Candidatus Peregrinibacteria bacterium GW2011_GWA2_44_7]